MMPNDGTNMWVLYKDELARDCFYKQLEMVGRLTSNRTFKDYPLEQYQLPKEANLKCPQISILKNYELEYYYDIEDYDSAVKLLNEMEQVEGLSKLLKYSFDTERLFIECMQGPREEVVEHLCTKELMNILKQSKNTPDMHRILMAYEGLYQKNTEQAKKHYDMARKLLEKYPIKGVANIESRFLEMIKEKIESLASEDENVAVTEEPKEVNEQ